ncbi:MAG TPA: hypothetical protein VL485_01390 [Ktedonobacteraceae bacterium]|nr:hypothetical protein [Ktedonobacteraceae bacterium]
MHIDEPNRTFAHVDNILELNAVRPLKTFRPFPPDIFAFPIGTFPDDPQHLPLVNSQVGNYFQDRQDHNLFWYLPAFQLLDGQDASFEFAATQNGVSQNGDPFNVASLTLSVKKIMSPDAFSAQGQHPAATFREIPFKQLLITFNTRYKDAAGKDQFYTHPGSAQFLADGTVRLSFNNILGPAVITAYENLTRTGESWITLSGLYEVWRWSPTPKKKIPPEIWTKAELDLSLLQTIPVVPVNPFRPDPPEPPDRLHLTTEINHTSEQLTLAQNPGVTELGSSGQPSVNAAGIGKLQLTTSAVEFQPTLAANVSAFTTIAQPIDASRLFDLNVSSPVFFRQKPVFIHPLPVGGTSTQGHYTQETAHVDMQLQPGKTFAATPYKLKFTINDGTGPRAILSVGDLRGFNVRQSEFSELHLPGDIAAKYPSFSRLFLGILSRTIVAIPARYGIVRSTTGCAAVCQALVDSTPGVASSSLFQFAFALGPIINPVDLVELSRDIAAEPNLQDCQLQLPLLLDRSVPQTLLTPFISNTCAYAVGAAPHTFSLAVVIREMPGENLAVTSANLFIKQLSTSTEPYLTGQFGLKLDDYYNTPIEATAILNFSATSGTEDLGFSIDEAQRAIVLANRSPLDLLLTRYATSTSSRLTVSPLHLDLENQKTTTLPLPPEHTDPSFLVVVDHTLKLDNPLTKQALGRYLAFQTQDVQQVQFDLGINASNIDFRQRGISRLIAQINFVDLPNVMVPSLTLSSDLLVTRSRIVIPVEYAISKLVATITFTVQWINPQHGSFTFTRTNDFIDFAIFVVQSTDIPAGQA